MQEHSTRRDFFKAAVPAVAAGALGFPAVIPAQARAASVTDSGAATNGYLWSLLSSQDRDALRAINVTLTNLAIQQSAITEVANQILYDTRIAEALATFLAHGVTPKDLVNIAQSFDVVFLWSLVYGDVHHAFNARFVHFPLAVVFPRTVDEVVAWVSFVRDHQFSVAIRSGGNSYEGFSSEAEIVIDLTFLALDDTGAQFRLDLASGVVHVASGVRLGVLYTELAKAGVAFAGGQCSPVCAGGLVGTGGVGFSTRTFGYACDQLVEVEYVLADGRVIVASATNQFSDLFFATKGAGAAGLGVMTRLTLTVVSAKTLLFYALTFQLLDAAIVIDKWQNLVAAPAALSSSIVNLTAATPVLGPPTFFVDGEFRVEQGTIQDAKAELELILRTQWLSQLPSPLNQTQIVMEAVSVVEAATIAASQVPMPTLNQWKLKSNFFFNRISAPALQPLVDFLLNNAPANDPTTAVGAITISLHGGMANQIAPRSAVVPARAGTVAWFHGGAFWNQQSLEPQCLEFVNSLFRVAAPILGSQTAFYGCPDRELGTQSPKGSPGSNYNYLKAYWSGPTLNFVPFLLGVKRRYDPQDVFRFAQSIPVNAAL